MANKVIVEVRAKLEHGQNLFRRSTVEKLVTEYERLLLRNVTLEQSAAQPPRAVDATICLCDSTVREPDKSHTSPGAGGSE